LVGTVQCVSTKVDTCRQVELPGIIVQQ